MRIKKSPITRKSFLKKASIAVLSSGVLLAGCSGDKTDNGNVELINVNFNKTFKWKMVTTWPPKFPVIGEGCDLLADWIGKMSGGRLQIKVYGGGELGPALETFEAVSSAHLRWVMEFPITVQVRHSQLHFSLLFPLE